ncbi:OB-fold domain-containing protein [Candidatus Microgenomates bacterium]|nr:OB-fold domain-containing protein [Candidatus Microgenomates bacterium]
MSSPVTIWRSHKKLSAYLNKEGRLVIWTKIYVAPVGFEHQVPYLVGIVQFDPPAGGERMPLQIVDCEEQDLKVNQKVVTVIRRIGKTKSEDVIEYGLKVKPRS